MFFLLFFFFFFLILFSLVLQNITYFDSDSANVLHVKSALFIPTLDITTDLVITTNSTEQILGPRIDRLIERFWNIYSILQETNAVDIF